MTWSDLTEQQQKMYTFYQELIEKKGVLDALEYFQYKLLKKHLSHECTEECKKDLARLDIDGEEYEGLCGLFK